MNTYQKIYNYFKGEEKIEPPFPRAIIKINEVAKESGIYDDENKIIELYDYNRLKILKYSEEQVEVLRENGIPVLEENYSEEYEFLNIDSGGGIESWRR